MTPHQPHGLFVLDSRSLSRWELRINGHPVESLAVDDKKPFSAVYVCRAVAGRGSAEADVVVMRRRDIGNGMRERISVVNYGLDNATVVVTLRCDVDFADLFAVKDNRVVPSPERRHEVEDGRILPRCSRRLDALGGLVLGEAKSLGSARCLQE